MTAPLTIDIVMKRLSTMSTSPVISPKYKAALDECRQLIIALTKKSGNDSSRSIEQLIKDI